MDPPGANEKTMLVSELKDLERQVEEIPQYLTWAIKRMVYVKKRLGMNTTETSASFTEKADGNGVTATPPVRSLVESRRPLRDVMDRPDVNDYGVPAVRPLMDSRRSFLIDPMYDRPESNGLGAGPPPPRLLDARRPPLDPLMNRADGRPPPGHPLMDSRRPLYEDQYSPAYPTPMDRPGMKRRIDDPLFEPRDRMGPPMPGRPRMMPDDHLMMNMHDRRHMMEVDRRREREEQMMSMERRRDRDVNMLEMDRRRRLEERLDREELEWQNLATMDLDRMRTIEASAGRPYGAPPFATPGLVEFGRPQPFGPNHGPGTSFLFQPGGRGPPPKKNPNAPKPAPPKPKKPPVEQGAPDAFPYPEEIYEGCTNSDERRKARIDFQKWHPHFFPNRVSVWKHIARVKEAMDRGELNEGAPNLEIERLTKFRSMKPDGTPAAPGCVTLLDHIVNVVKKMDPNATDAPMQ
ncbi:hypothetical protein Ddc_16046 [Ditylenchus destructor]|nr:hypothetical protein Ddc_16046 [Ditylenchus destructor]